ncbi:hypothetical protein LTR08_005947 [Meristemomyces frigidus]|nr:hypothetical protein LTR08_005947 [Meristemomyces frigidus]
MSLSRLAPRRALQVYASATAQPHNARPLFHRKLHASPRLDVVRPFLLADIGEGITECQLIQWFVQPGARVEQFDKLCEVQSDKASVEITSPFDGVIKKLHYGPDDMAVTGKPLVDIDIQGEVGEEGGVEESVEDVVRAEGGGELDAAELDAAATTTQERGRQHGSRQSKEVMGSLATPAVRHLTKEMNVNISDVQGTGRDGRVLKEDVHRHVSQQTQQTVPQQQQRTGLPATREDKKAPLTPVQTQMFKAMTRSLSIPHFLYTCAADMGAITSLRKKLNVRAEPKLTHLPFIIKAVSLALRHHPLLNSSLDTKDPKKPELTYRGAHHFGVAMDTPSGLLVPVIHNVQDLSITEVAARLLQLSEKARNNKLAPSDFSSATFTISNIGSVGGGVVAPIITEPQVGILGIGRSRMVPAFDENGQLVKKEELVLSWSADHRVVDGAECARCAERVRGLLEEPGSMIMGMR